jgi:hypothetical protein
MKRHFLVTSLLVCFASPAAAQDFWTRLGMSEDDAKNHIWKSVSGRSLTVPLLPALRVLPAGARKTVITQASAYARTWVSSEDFRNRYAELRQSQKPRAPEGMGSTETRKKQDRARVEQSIKELEGAAKTAPAQQQPMIREMIQMQKDQLKAIDDPGNRLYSKETESAFAAMDAAGAAEHAENLKRWEAAYPAEPSAMIRDKLREFLAMSRDIDFGAALTTRADGKKIFVNPAYESKPAGWKALFRAGSETTAAVRGAAEEWLTRLR